MSGQYVGERFDRPEDLVKNDQTMAGPAVNSNFYTDNTPMEAVVIAETKVDEMPSVVATEDDMSVQMAPPSEPIPQEAVINASVGSQAALLDREASEHFRTRWNEIQGKFVDEPQSAVQEADALVSEVITNITQMFASEHSSLEGQWNRGSDVSTEDLRQALQHYRSFFNRLVV